MVLGGFGCVASSMPSYSVEVGIFYETLGPVVGSPVTLVSAGTVDTNSEGIAVFSDLSSGIYTIQTEWVPDFPVTINIGQPVWEYTIIVADELDPTLPPPELTGIRG